MPSTNGHGSKLERVALYLRVSSEEQRERETIDLQRDFLEQYRSLYELEIAKRYMKTTAYPAPFPCTRGQRVGGSSRTPKRATFRPCSSTSSTGWAGPYSSSWTPTTGLWLRPG